MGIESVFEAIETRDLGKFRELLDREPALLGQSHTQSYPPAGTRFTFTPIDRAAELGLNEFVAEALSRGARPFSGYHRNVINKCAFSVAKARGFGEIVDLIITHELGRIDSGNQKIDDQDAKGNTPLHWAAYFSHWPLVQKLLERGASANAVNADGLKPIHLSLYKGVGGRWRAPVFDLPDMASAALLAQKTRPLDFWLQVGLGDHAAVRSALEARPGLANQRAEWMRFPGAANFPLFIACYMGDWTMAKLLLDHGADPDARNQDGHYSDAGGDPESGETLAIAVRRTHEKAVDALLAGGARLEEHTCNPSALYAAFENGNFKLYDRLVLFGAKHSAFERRIYKERILRELSEATG